MNQIKSCPRWTGGITAAVVLLGALVHAGHSQPAAGAGEGTKSDSKVKITVTADKPDSEGKQVVTIEIAIEKDWHIYANPLPEDFPGVATVVTVDAKVKPQEVKIEYPEGKHFKDREFGAYNRYEDKATIKAVVRRAKGDTGPLELSVKIQACSHFMNQNEVCLSPAIVKLMVP